MSGNRFLLMPCLMLLAVAPGQAAGEVYRWVDEYGVVHFSDKQPALADAEFSTVDIGLPPAASYDPDADAFNIEATRTRTQNRRTELQEKRKARSERARNASPPAAQAPKQRTYPDGVAWPRPPGYPVQPIHPGPEPGPGPGAGPEPQPPSTLLPPGPVAVPLVPADGPGG